MKFKNGRVKKGRLKKVNLPRYETPGGYRNPVPYTSPTGIKTHLYSVGAVAFHLGRTAGCIKKWEISGTIPMTPFKIGGDRMYAAEHLDVLLECAEQCHIRSGVKIQNTSFSSKVYKGYERVYNLFFVDSEGKEGYKDGN